MHMTALFGGLAVISAVLAGLITHVSPQPTTRIKVPTDFWIQREESGGMMPSGSLVVITPTEIQYERYGAEDTKERWQATPTPAEIEKLYQALETKQFATIQTYTEKVYDRGGITISYMANEQTITKSDSGQSFVKKGESTTRFYAINDIIMDIVASHAK